MKNFFFSGAPLLFLPGLLPFKKKNPPIKIKILGGGEGLPKNFFFGGGWGGKKTKGELLMVFPKFFSHFFLQKIFLFFFLRAYILPKIFWGALKL